MLPNNIAGTEKPRVLLAGHLPPPMSGIGTYYQILLGSSLPERINMKFIDTSARRRPLSKTGSWSFSNLISAGVDCVRFAKAVIEFRPEICHIATAFGLSFAKHSVCVLIAKLMGSKVLIHPHCSFDIIYGRQNKYWRWFVRQILRNCSGIVVLSNEWKSLQEVLPGSLLHYLPNAINVSIYRKDSWETKSKFDKTCLHILYLGYIGKAKGSFDLISAAEKVLEQHPEVIFELVGQELTAGEINQIIARVEEVELNKSIHIIPPVFDEEKTKLLHSADIFVYPSYHEGMPMAVIEAMASGLPIIATQVGGLPDLVCSGKNGLLVQAGQPDKLAEAVHQLIIDPKMRNAMGVESFRIAQENFDIEKLVDRLLDIYRSTYLRDKEISTANFL